MIPEWYDDIIEEMTFLQMDKNAIMQLEKQKAEKLESCIKCYYAGEQCFKYFIDAELKNHGYKWLEHLANSLEDEEIKDKIESIVLMHKMSKNC